MKKVLIVAIALSMFATSCKKEKNNTTTNEKRIERQCGYTINTLNSSIEWTAFKTTQKVGVGGEFTGFTFQPKQLSTTSMEQLFTGLKFDIDVNTVNTKNEVRDKKIIDSFFGTLTKKKPLTGTVKSFKDGKALVDLKMANTIKEVPFNYIQNGDVVSFTATIDVNDWQGNAAIKALNDVCFDLHKGTDGVSKLWSEVDIKIETEIDKENCE